VTSQLLRRLQHRLEGLVFHYTPTEEESAAVNPEAPSPDYLFKVNRGHIGVPVGKTSSSTTPSDSSGSAAFEEGQLSLGWHLMTV